MANYTAADVKRLREKTGAGMMDCKKALEEAAGDFEKAVEALRIKGAKDVGKRAERSTAEGLVAAEGGVLIELNSETDFVAKNDEFIELAAKIVGAVKGAGATDLGSALAAPLDGKTVGEIIQDLSAKIGEKLELRRVANLDGEVATYLHRRATDLPPAVGVLVQYTGPSEEAARAAAMQVAALRPKYLSRDDVPSEIVEDERRIAEETAKAEGKPEQALPKIVEGRLNGYFKENTLLEQSSVQDSKKTVKALLEEAGVTVTGFVRFEVGQV
ncbi:translation elongation factor Ts [Saccharopolyspora sp. CA-218241]|uniref:translation elongation factor Ts n=1 Tax=Saccharopolyspora sp. CA-218241 TaxID=3240027 RepID=UPI003D95AA08